MSDGRAIAAITAAIAAILLPIGPGVAPTLYRITPNSRARNTRPLPGVVTVPATAIDLHYLVTSAGDASLQLGAAITVLANMPVLDGATIDSLVPDTGLHGAIGAAETVQLAMATLTLDESSRLWRALGQPLQPALFYTVGPVLLA